MFAARGSGGGDYRTCGGGSRARRTPGELLVRSDADFATIAAGIRAAAQQLDPGLVVRVGRLEQNLGLWQRISRLTAGVAGSLGATALVLALVGIYGVVGYAVSRRVREIGIRLALGAAHRDVLALVLRRAMRPVTVGVVLGLVAFLAVSRVLESLLLGVSSLDPTALGAATLLVLGAALLASFVPARRATRLDPTTTLRHE